VKKSEERSYTEQNVRDALRYILGQLHLNQTTISPATAITKCGCEGLRMARTVPAPPPPPPPVGRAALRICHDRRCSGKLGKATSCWL
jgi:hypothetical protein